MEPRSPDGAGGSGSVGRPAEAAHPDSARGPQAPEDTAHSGLPLPHPAALLRSTALARRAALSSSRVGCHSSRAWSHCAVRKEWRSREPAQVHPVKAPCTDAEAPRGETRSTPALLWPCCSEPERSYFQPLVKCASRLQSTLHTLRQSVSNQLSLMWPHKIHVSRRERP